MTVLLSLSACEGTVPNGHGAVDPDTHADTPAPCKTVRLKVVDLSHVMKEGMPFWPGGVPFKMTRLVDYDAGYRFHKFEMGENTGTHVDAPSHITQGGKNLPDIPVDELVVPLAVLDVKAKVEKSADYLVSGSDIVDWESANGPVPVASVLVVNTGWHQRFDDPAKYLNQDDQGVMHFPGVSAEAAEMLVERDVVGVGIDTLSIDHGPAKEFVAHKVLTAANKYMLENLANLDDLPDTGATIIVGVLKVADGTQAQARVLALVPEKEKTDEEKDEEEEAEKGKKP